MKKYILLFFTLFFLSNTNSQEKTVAFKSGEWLRYKMSYSGFLRAGTAILEVEEKELNGKKVYHSKGSGWTSGMIKWFFDVDDKYESYFPGHPPIEMHKMMYGYARSVLGRGTGQVIRIYV